ncbi:hypothetical protein VTH82DRAFT_848 [Thermothelomyces myriococcoides]
MNFYAASNMPVYRAERDARHKESKSALGHVSKKSKILGLQSPQRDATSPPPVRPVTSAEATLYDAPSIDQLLDPAVEGPPSPESIRELGQRMKRASVNDKHQSHQTTSSGSSSLRSLTSADRPSWDNGPDGKTLSRRSSGRSTSSSMPSKERPESVQIFGKTIFSRKGRARRESSTQGSSSSLYSTDVVADALQSAQRSASGRESTIPALFGLRRNAKQDQAGESHRKLTISGPYNFQHVAHTQREDALVLEHGSQSVSASESAQPHGQGWPKGARADEMHFAGFSSDSLPLGEEDVTAAAPTVPYETSLRRKPSVVKKRSSSRRVLNRSQSQEQIRTGVPPPRPPRSPVDQSASGGPVVPPRGPSRMFNRHERFDSIDRPQTSASFRGQQQYADPPGSPPATSYGYAPDMDVIHEHAASTTAIGSRDEANWPLPCPSSNTSQHTLSHVPEEEEQLPAHSRQRSRASIASNSSLRGSQSVPMLRGFAARQNGESARRTSDASDTLGRFEMLAAQQALRQALIENQDALPREDWEDDIDYCYDHEAEANCDYEWSRPSLETCRDGETATPVDDLGRGSESCVASPAMLTPAQFDMPDLSPVSQVSSPTPQEAITPTAMNNPKASNFSLPRLESKNMLHVRKPSDASSFRESQGFTLSPSLLIPMDYQQQMAAYEAERNEASDFSFRHFEEHELNMDPSALLLRYRTSASTTGTIESSSSAFNKHDSTVSTSTDYTRMTASVSSLEMDNCLQGTEPLQRFPSFESQGRTESKTAMPALPEARELNRPPARRPHFKSRGSESNLGRLTMDEPSAAKTRPPIPARRGRAMTTGLGTPPPPNQYALFPQVQLSGNRI